MSEDQRPKPGEEYFECRCGCPDLALASRWKIRSVSGEVSWRETWVCDRCQTRYTSETKNDTLPTTETKPSDLTDLRFPDVSDV